MVSHKGAVLSFLFPLVSGLETIINILKYIYTSSYIPVVSDKGGKLLLLFPLETGLETIMNIHNIL